jgi:hypothetical protein
VARALVDAAVADALPVWRPPLTRKAWRPAYDRDGNTPSAPAFSWTFPLPPHFPGVDSHMRMKGSWRAAVSLIRTPHNVYIILERFSQLKNRKSHVNDAIQEGAGAFGCRAGFGEIQPAAVLPHDLVSPGQPAHDANAGTERVG